MSILLVAELNTKEVLELFNVLKNQLNSLEIECFYTSFEKVYALLKGEEYDFLIISYDFLINSYK